MAKSLDFSSQGWPPLICIGILSTETRVPRVGNFLTLLSMCPIPIYMVFIYIYIILKWHYMQSLQSRHNEHDGISNHQPHDCKLNHLLRRRSKKTSKLRITGRWDGNSLATGEFPAQMPVTQKTFHLMMSLWCFVVINAHCQCISTACCLMDCTLSSTITLMLINITSLETNSMS